MKLITSLVFLFAILADFGQCQYYDYVYYVDDVPQVQAGLRAGNPYLTNNPFTRPADTSTGFLNKYTSGAKWKTPYPGTLVL